MNRLGIRHTEFEILEHAPADLAPRAHQYYADIDTTHFNPTFDLYGGGGYISTMKDEIEFLRSLLGGKVFQRGNTLETMRAISYTNDESGYARGIVAHIVGDHICWGHTGFWGTAFYHCPREDVTIATDQHQAQFPPNFDRLELLSTLLQINSLVSGNISR